MFQEDPFDRICRIIDGLLIYLSVLVISTLQLEVSLLLLRLKRVKVNMWTALRLLWNRIWFGFRRMWNHFYWDRIYVVLVLIGAKRELTWAEVERRRVEAFTLYGLEISRSPELEEGLKQEHMLSQH